MKHNHTFADLRHRWHGKQMPPLRTAAELAKEFGITLRQLSAYIGHDAQSPKPVLTKDQHGTSNTWYNPKQMRAWWAARKL